MNGSTIDPRSGEGQGGNAALSASEMERLVAPARRDRIFRIVSYFSPLLILLFWELASRGGLVDRRFFPPPSAIAETAWKMTASGEIFVHIWATFQRVAIGYVLGAIPGLAFGLALGMSSRLNRVLGPIFAALYPVPKIAILPLILLLFGIGELSKWIVVAIGVFFLMFYNTLSGVRQTPQIYLDVARNAGASRLQTFARIAIPAALPSIFTGLRLSAGTAYIVIAATEFLGARSGVGFFIWASWQVFAVARMFVGVVVISLMGYLTLLALELIERRMVPWSRH
jgi:NitT/TauT family transport system permease protein